MKKDDINVPVVDDEETKQKEYKTPKYKRVLAIVGIAIFGIGIVGSVGGWIADSGTTVNTVFQIIAIVGLAIGFMIFLFLYMSGSMPFKREKMKEQQRIRMEYDRKMAEEEEAVREGETIEKDEKSLNYRADLERSELEESSELK